MSYLDLAHMHLQSYRASFVSYKTSLYSAVSSLSLSGLVPPVFFTNNQLTVEDFTAEQIRRVRKLTTAIQIGFEATSYKVQIFLEVTVWQGGLSIVLGKQNEFELVKLRYLLRHALHYPNKDETTTSVYRLSHEFVAVATDNSQNVEWSVTTHNQCSGTSLIMLC